MGIWTLKQKWVIKSMVQKFLNFDQWFVGKIMIWNIVIWVLKRSASTRQIQLYTGKWIWNSIGFRNETFLQKFFKRTPVEFSRPMSWMKFWSDFVESKTRSRKNDVFFVRSNKLGTNSRVDNVFLYWKLSEIHLVT